MSVMSGFNADVQEKVTQGKEFNQTLIWSDLNMQFYTNVHTVFLALHESFVHMWIDAD